MIQLNRIIMIALMAVLCAEFTACDDDKIPVTDIFVDNRSDEVIYATYIGIYEGRYEDIYLDRAMASALDEIMPGETCRVYVLGENDREKRSQIYIFKKSTLRQYSYKEIVENQIVDFWMPCKYDILKPLDFRIVFENDK